MVSRQSDSLNEIVAASFDDFKIVTSDPETIRRMIAQGDKPTYITRRVAGQMAYTLPNSATWQALAVAPPLEMASV